MKTTSFSESGAVGTNEHSKLRHIDALADANRFISNLADMRGELPGQPNRRGQLAQLKRNAGEKWPGRGVAWFGEIIYQGKESDWREQNAELYFLVATLFDLNRFSLPRAETKSKPRDMGASLRLAITNGANEFGVKQRFQILLDSNWDEFGDGELAFRLRQMVQWLSGQKVGVDWALLLADLCFWNSESRFVQKNWARSFFNVPQNLRDTDLSPSESEAPTKPIKSNLI
jgi:CRISPR system Cascade subunit CasB